VEYIICITIINVDFIHIKKHDGTETGLYLRLQVEPTQLDPVEKLVCIPGQQQQRQRLAFILDPTE
jgi:hypothetical protein